MLQQLLVKRGYETLSIDGVFGVGTDAAVKDFQTRYGLDVDGRVGYRTWEKLFFPVASTSQTLTEQDFVCAAMLLDVETAALKAVQDVETGEKSGFLTSGEPRILFEGHVFWKELELRNINPMTLINGNEDILYCHWTKKYYGENQYERLEKARKINIDAANASASWGMFQIMGNNYKDCGEKSISGFVESMYESAQKQLLLSARFINGDRAMLAALQKKDWAGFAMRYNGKGYKDNQYDTKLATAYRNFCK